MKVGELYDLAKQAFPPITKRMFTQFFNMALEDISSQVRISVVEEELDDLDYSNILSNSVKIEEIVTDSTYRWNNVNNEMVFYDNDGNVVTPTYIRVKYWKRVKDAISDSTQVISTISTVVDGDTRIVNLGTLPYNGIYLLMDDVYRKPNTGTSVLTISKNSVISFSADKRNVYLYGDFNDFISATTNTYTTIKVVEGALGYLDMVNTRVITVSTLWEEQETGFEDDVDLCAMYMALSISAEFSSDNREGAKIMSERAGQWLTKLRKKYNTIRTNTSIRQVGL